MIYYVTYVCVANHVRYARKHSDLVTAKAHYKKLRKYPEFYTDIHVLVNVIDKEGEEQ